MTVFPGLLAFVFAAAGEVAQGTPQTIMPDVAAAAAEGAAVAPIPVALPAEDSAAGAALDEPAPLRLYGFADIGYQRMMPNPGASLNNVVVSNKGTFVLGNLNLYVDAQPSESWSGLIEVRLTTLPNGVESTCPVGEACRRTMTEVYDPTGVSGWSTVRWGGIVLERAYIQWHMSDLLSIRVGSFLTPFGIWNVDHGTPTLISLALPAFEVNELFPIRQLGVEVLGSTYKGEWELGYFAYMSNGRTPGQVDYTDDKMFGGRIFARRTSPFRLAVGISGLMGRYSDHQRRVTSYIPYELQRKEVVAYREEAGGADVSLDMGRLRLRSEFAIRRAKYEQGKRPLFFNLPGLYTPDRLEWDMYALVAYQLPFWGLEPYLYFEAYRFPTWISEGLYAPSAGVNIHFAPHAQLKAQYLEGRFINFSNGERRSIQDFRQFMMRLVLAF